MIASGLLVLAFALIVIYTSRRAFYSPIAIVVVAAIGLVAVLLQRRLTRRPQGSKLPIWLNWCGVVLALCTLFGDALRLSQEWTEVAALGAVGCFGIGSVIVLETLRKDRATLNK